MHSILYCFTESIVVKKKKLNKKLKHKSQTENDFICARNNFRYVIIKIKMINNQEKELFPSPLGKPQKKVIFLVARALKIAGNGFLKKNLHNFYIQYISFKIFFFP